MVYFCLVHCLLLLCLAFEPSLPPLVIVWLSNPPGKSGRRRCWRGSAGLRILGLSNGFPATTYMYIPSFFFLGL